MVLQLFEIALNCTLRYPQVLLKNVLASSLMVSLDLVNMHQHHFQSSLHK